MKNKKKYVGVLAVQGDVSEHVTALQEIGKKVLQITCKEDVEKISALIIPGGESSAISQIIVRNGIHDAIAKRINEHSLPILGTCAGCVLMANKIATSLKDIKPFKAINMEIARNDFGRQKESFITSIQFKGFAKPLEAVFIRAPSIKKVWQDSEILAQVDDKIVAVRQHEFVALAFHPELTPDRRIYNYFFDAILRE